MTCRVCLLSVKKSAVICQSCNLICHSKCAENAPPTCDLRAQLLLYAQYAENGNQGGVYATTVDPIKAAHMPTNPASEVVYNAAPLVSSQSGQDDSGLSSSQPKSPSTAFKFMDAFKRPRAVSPDTQGPVDSTPGDDRDDPLPERKAIPRKSSVLKKIPRPRPVSIASSTTERHSASMLSARESESYSSRQDSSHRSKNSARSKRQSLVDVGRHDHERALSPTNTSIRHKKKDSNCAIQ